MWSLNMMLTILLTYAGKTKLDETAQNNQVQLKVFKPEKLVEPIFHHIKVLASNQTDLFTNQKAILTNQAINLDQRPNNSTDSKDLQQLFEKVDESKPVIGIANQSDVLNGIEVHIVNLTKAPAALNTSEEKTQNSSSSSERERLKIRTPSGFNVFPKIVGGTRTSIKLYPYTVQLYAYRYFHCGGSVVTKDHILTAAHCVKDEKTGRITRPENLHVLVGSTFLYEGSRYYVSAFAIHPGYNNLPHNNDIAVLLLAKTLVYTDKIQKATLPPQDYVLPNNAIVFAVGWGWFSDIPGVSSFLNRVAIKHIDQNTCIRNYAIMEKYSSYRLPITENMLCAGELGVGGKDACQGDSGGPLVNDNVLVGLTSWGADCGDPFYPGVYTRVSKYIKWINSVNIKTREKHLENLSVNFVDCPECGEILYDLVGSTKTVGETEQLKIKVPPILTPKILGGENADIEQYPFAIQLFRQTPEINQLVFMCGGTLVTRKHVLTASHCVTDEKGMMDIPLLYYVRVGTTIFDVGGRRHRVENMVIHPKFDSDLAANDIAILILSKRVTYSKQIDSACLPPQGYSLRDNVLVTALGWGDTDPKSVKVSEVLNHVTIVTINHAKCYEIYKINYAPINENMFCAGLLGVGGKDTCCGDSGGPLIHNGVVVGVTSWGADKCGDPNHPGVYAKTSSYIDWMKEVVATTSGCSSCTHVLILIILLAVLINSA